MQDLTMQHLREASGDAKKALNDAREPPKPKSAIPLDDPQRHLEYTFEFSHTDDTGKVWNGSFTNRVLNIAQKIQIGVVRARRLQGAPMASVSPRTLELLYIIGWMEESLTKRPAWAKDLLDLTDEDLVEQLWLIVARHESIFLGRGTPDRAGKDQPEPGPK